MTETPKPLAGQVAVVAGATRGAGRGIACMLGEAGATVYCTGRSTRDHPPAPGTYAGRTETIDETADMVTARGGTSDKSSTKMAPLFFRLSTTYLLWTISWRT